MVYPTKKRILLAAISATVFSFLILYLFIIHPQALSTRQVYTDNSNLVSQIIETGAAEPAVAATAKVVGLPTHLMIPKLNIDVAIEQVGVTTKGAMDTPKDFGNAGWFDQGPRPGEVGNAVITGHFGSIGGKSLIFNNLSDLIAGDVIEIIDDNSLVSSFVVTRSQSFDPSAETAGIFNSDDGKAHLNLITCGGVWDSITKKYSERLVVFSEQE